MELKSTVITDLLATYPDINLFILNNDFSIGAYNRLNFLNTFQSIINNPTTSSELKDENNNSFLDNIYNSKVILNESNNLYFVKYLLFGDIYVMGTWENEIAYRANLDFRRTIFISTVTTYFGMSLFAIVLLTIVFIIRKTMINAKKVADSLSEGTGDLTIRLPISNICLLYTSPSPRD